MENLTKAIVETLVALKAELAEHEAHVKRIKRLIKVTENYKVDISSKEVETNEPSQASE